MRADADNDIDILRQKTRLLERENVRLTERVTELLRKLNALQGMTPEMLELNLPKLVAQAKGEASTSTTKKSERHKPDGGATNEGDGGAKKPRAPGHGPTVQPQLKIEDEKFRVKEADKACDVCGETMAPWPGKDDVVDVVHRIPAQWVIKRCTLEKCRCPEGCTIVTAKGPKKLIPGGRYTADVAIQSCIEKFLFHIPIERQVRQAALVGMRITSQTLWDQQFALAFVPDGPRGKDRGDSFVVRMDKDVGAVVGPFLMGPINTRVVRRSNALLEYRYGADFRYREQMRFGRPRRCVSLPLERVGREDCQLVAQLLFEEPGVRQQPPHRASDVLAASAAGPSGRLTEDRQGGVGVVPHGRNRMDPTIEIDEGLGVVIVDEGERFKDVGGDAGVEAVLVWQRRQGHATDAWIDVDDVRADDLPRFGHDGRPQETASRPSVGRGQYSMIIRDKSSGCRQHRRDGRRGCSRPAWAAVHIRTPGGSDVYPRWQSERRPGGCVFRPS